MAPEATPDAAAPQGPRQTLAMRLAARNRQRELRAERLARLQPASESIAGPVAESAAGRIPASGAASEATATPAIPVTIPGATPASIEAAETALEDFLRTLTSDLPPLPEGPPIEPGELLPFQRPVATVMAASAETTARPPSDLDRLPGVGPGLIWALERAGLCRLADLAPLAPTELAARLGPLGRLIPAERWIAAAREAEA